MVAWAAYRGVLVSARMGHEYSRRPISVMLAGMLKNRNSVRLEKELAIERVRQLRYPNQISRLVGMYFFEDSAALQEIAEWGGHFTREYQAELGIFPGASISRHDANWITFAPLDSSGNLTTVDWIDHYWAGESFPNRIPIWELIVNGRAAVYGTDLRARAYESIKSKFPECVAILEIARIAACLNSDLGQSMAWLTQTSMSEFSLQYYLDMRDADDPEFLERVKNFDSAKNYADLLVGDDTFTVPNFQEFGETFHTTDGFSAQFFSGIYEKTNDHQPQYNDL